MTDIAPGGRVAVALLRVVCALVVATLLGCASPPPQHGPAPESAPPASTSKLDDMMRRDLAEDHAFPWSATRPLTWADFQGRPPVGGPEGAKTSYVLYSLWKCKGEVFDYRVAVAFRPRESWVKELVLNDSLPRRTVLEHEQTHFDLGEVYARRLRQAFKAMADPCHRTDEELGAVADRIGRDEKDEQSRYDSETTHGLRATQQAAWTTETRRRLAAAK